MENLVKTDKELRLFKVYHKKLVISDILNRIKEYRSDIELNSETEKYNDGLLTGIDKIADLIRNIIEIKWTE